MTTTIPTGAHVAVTAAVQGDDAEGEKTEASPHRTHLAVGAELWLRLGGLQRGGGVGWKVEDIVVPVEERRAAPPAHELCAGTRRVLELVFVGVRRVVVVRRVRVVCVVAGADRVGGGVGDVVVCVLGDRGREDGE